MWSIIRGTTLVADLTLVPSHAMKVCCCCIPVSIWTCTVKHAKSSGTPWESGCRNPFASSPLCSSCTRKRNAGGCAWLSLSGPQHFLPLLTQATQSSMQRAGTEAGLIGCLLWRGLQCLCLFSAKLCSQASEGQGRVPSFLVGCQTTGLTLPGWQLLPSTSQQAVSLPAIAGGPLSSTGHVWRFSRTEPEQMQWPAMRPDCCL